MMVLTELRKSKGYATDKSDDYLDLYEKECRRFRYDKNVILELGILRAESLRLWRDYFPNSLIVGVDLNPPVITEDMIVMYKAAQDDTAALDLITKQAAPDGYQMVIDDCAHIAVTALHSFWFLWPHVKPGGLYVIEDWGTGYWGTWPDGAPTAPARFSGKEIISHQFGMVGMLKLLIDEIEKKRIAQMIIRPGIAILQKT
jgi:hypothetical protein